MHCLLSFDEKLKINKQRNIKHHNHATFLIDKVGILHYKKWFIFHLQEFEKRNVKLLGISCEDVGQLNVWAEDVRALYKLEEFPITLLADEDRKVAFQ